MIVLSVINESSVVSDTEVRAATRALNKQVRNDFGPAWGIDARVVYHSQRTKPPADSWVMAILDDSDQAGALGYHDLTPDLLPLAKVFAGTDLQYGLSWTVTASHEALEILADPDCNLAAQFEDNAWVGFEVCDPCEADQYGYTIDDIVVSDFVFPAWFQPGKPGPHDFTGHLSQPLALLPGGYASVWTPDKGWSQITARTTGETVSRLDRGTQRIGVRSKSTLNSSSNPRIDRVKETTLTHLL